MEFLALLGIGLLITVVIVPWIALAKANDARAELRRLYEDFAELERRFEETVASMNAARNTERRQPPPSTVAPDTAPVHSFEAPQRFTDPIADLNVDPVPATAPPSWVSPTKAPEPVEPAVDLSATLTEAHAYEPVAPTEPLPPPPPREPSAFELEMRKWIGMGKEWLFGGNLVAKVGLLILFIGVAFLVRLASNYVTVPIELRLAGVAAGAVALLVWGWRIRESRRGIALPAQGAALAILMLVTFGAFKLFHVLPGGAAFLLLFVLIAFTCILAVLQDALWLAVFGIAGGFAAPILTSTGGGSHVALFSYYCLLNAGVLAIALLRSWRMLNVLGFAFTFIVGAAWGEQRYVPENYASAQAFLIVFWLFYIVIATVYAWRRAPLLKSYVDGTLVFGVPMAGMALQYGLVKEIHFGMAISALVIALTYATTASALWRWRSGTLRLLVESFLALAIVFGTLAIPLAFDGRWTSAAWAVEGAAIVWIGLKQKQKLAWQFGVAVQLGSWIAFVTALAGLDPLAALKGNVGLSFLLLGVTGVLLALMFRRQTPASEPLDYEARARRGFTWLANGFICVAVVWLLLGMWVEVWLRLNGAHRASMLVATALVLVFALQFLSKKSLWRLPDKLGSIVAGVAGILFAVLMFKHMEWRNVAYYDVDFGQLLGNSSLLGGLMLCGGALVSAFAFRNREASSAGESATTATMAWLLAAIFWWCGFVLHGLAHAIEFLSGPRHLDNEVPWYALSFWSTYSIGLALSAWTWTHFARRKQFPKQRWMLLVFWPALSALAGLLYWKQIAPQVRWLHAGSVSSAATVADAFINLIASPLCGGLLLCAMAWRALWTVKRDDSLSDKEANTGIATWTIGLGFAWYAVSLDAIAAFATDVLHSAVSTLQHSGWLLTYAQCALLIASLSAMMFISRARVTQLSALRWLAGPAAVLQAVASAALLIDLYIDTQLPAPNAAVALVGCWLGIAWCLRSWLRDEWLLQRWTLQTLHFGRVIAPWLAIAPAVSLSIARWLQADVSAAPMEAGWIVAGMWPDYLAAWISIGSLFALLRQAKQDGWPLTPLQEWYRRLLIPLATLWGVLAVIYWNVRQDGTMAPLPYLPILNPLDLTTGFAALLAVAVWRANAESVAIAVRGFGIKAALGLSFGWLNLMLLRTAAHYLDIPYRFHALYESQFIQSMLSIVWTLTAFLLMRHAVRVVSKPLWLVGAALLAVVVAKLAAIDLSNVGSVARIVSFMGVGGLMVVIGYLAPLPRSHATVEGEPA